MKEETIKIQGLSIGYIHKKETKVIAKDMDATICMHIHFIASQDYIPVNL